MAVSSTRNFDFLREQVIGCILRAMSAQYQPETAPDLMEAVKQAGFSISPQQLARWHRAGLVPQPHQRSLGRGKGTRTEYPPGTARQLVALLHLRKRFRHLDDVGSRLWWRGFAVSERYSTGQLQAAAKLIDDVKRKALEAINARDGDDETRSDSISEMLESLTHARLPAGFVKRVRKRVGRGGFVSLASRLMEVVAGLFAATSTFEDPAETLKDNRILEKATGLSRARQKMPNGLPRLSIGDLAVRSAFSDIASVFASEPFERLVNETSDTQWAEARDELRDLLLVIHRIVRGFQAIFGLRNPLGLNVLADIAEDASALALAMILILYRAMKVRIFHGEEHATITACRVFLAQAAKWDETQRVKGAAA